MSAICLGEQGRSNGDVHAFGEVKSDAYSESKDTLLPTVQGCVAWKLKRKMGCLVP